MATLFAGCESEVRNKTSKNFEKILTQKRKIQNISEEEPTVSEQLTREIHSQMDHSLKKEGKFKFGSK
ncbi:hypothetical protein [Campylobacter sp.]|uniref:hypothetical protein n=1 Tax=Campylobacter sp. TaxID=205 RepID=UPI00403EB84C